MISRTRPLAALVLALAAGCENGTRLPTPTEAGGQVLLGGQPLPNAKVTFTPAGADLPANAIATGVTDQNGRFRLTTDGKPGAVPGEHVVTVTEGPPPDGVRGENGQEQDAKYRAGLKNRPIPARYANITKSDVRVTVAAGQTEYKIELTR